MHFPSLLIVDDNAVDRLILKKELQKATYKGHIFEKVNGEDALNFLGNFISNRSEFGEKFPPQCIFLDINMPRVNGFEFLEGYSLLIEQNDTYFDSVIIMISSSDRRMDIDKAFAFPFVKNYLVKGKYLIDDLAQAITMNISANSG